MLFEHLNVILKRHDTFSICYKFQGSNIDCLTLQLLLLNVSNNKLKSLPESIGSCFSLEELQANGMFKSFFKLTCSCMLATVA